MISADGSGAYPRCLPVFADLLKVKIDANIMHKSEGLSQIFAGMWSALGGRPAEASGGQRRRKHRRSSSSDGVTANFPRNASFICQHGWKWVVLGERVARKMLRASRYSCTFSGSLFERTGVLQPSAGALIFRPHPEAALSRPALQRKRRRAKHWEIILPPSWQLHLGPIKCSSVGQA